MKPGELNKMQGLTWWYTRLFLASVTAEFLLFVTMILKWSNMNLFWIKVTTSPWAFAITLGISTLVSALWQIWVSWYQAAVQPPLVSAKSMYAVFRHLTYLSAISSLMAAFTAQYGVNDNLVSILTSLLIIDILTKISKRHFEKQLNVARSSIQK